MRALVALVAAKIEVRGQTIEEMPHKSWAKPHHWRKEQTREKKKERLMHVLKIPWLSS